MYDYDNGHLQHGQGTSGPFRTECVTVRLAMPDNWQAWFEGRWRKVFVTMKGSHIVFQGEKITIQIEGV
jgi:hypothetical protein